MTDFYSQPTRTVISDRAQPIIDRVEALAEDLQSEAAASEELGRLTDTAFGLLQDAGLTRLLMAEEYGGDALFPGEALPILERIAYIDGSAGWINTIFASSGQMLNWLNPEAVREILEAGDPLFAASSMPTGRGIPVEGGYRFSGQYSYSSGGLHATHTFCSGFILDEAGGFRTGPDGSPHLFMFIVPNADVVHRGNWDTLGLRGTGSVDFTVEDVFVPEHLVVDMMRPAPHGGPEGKGGMMLVIHLMHLGFASGITRRILDEIAAHANRPSKRPGALSLAETERFRMEYAQHELAASAARALAQQAWDSIDASLRKGEPIARRQITNVFGANVHIHDVAREVALWAFQRGGGVSLRQGTLQRAIRDALAGAQHMIVDDAHLVDIGWELLGAPENVIWAGPSLAEIRIPEIV